MVALVTLDKKETGKKSTNMEKACFLKAMEDLEENGVHVSEVVTDAHLQIGAVMSKYLVLYYSILSLSNPLPPFSLYLHNDTFLCGIIDNTTSDYFCRK